MFDKSPNLPSNGNSRHNEDLFETSSACAFEQQPRREAFDLKTCEIEGYQLT